MRCSLVFKEEGEFNMSEFTGNFCSSVFITSSAQAHPLYFKGGNSKVLDFIQITEQTYIYTIIDV